MIKNKTAQVLLRAAQSSIECILYIHYICVCVRVCVIRNVTSAELVLSRTMWSSIRRLLSEQMSNANRTAHSSHVTSLSLVQHHLTCLFFFYHSSKRSLECIQPRQNVARLLLKCKRWCFEQTGCVSQALQLWHWSRCLFNTAWCI